MGKSATERMNSPQRRHEVRLRGLSVTGQCHAGAEFGGMK